MVWNDRIEEIPVSSEIGVFRNGELRHIYDTCGCLVYNGPNIDEVFWLPNDLGHEKRKPAYQYWSNFGHDIIGGRDMHNDISGTFEL